jgi:hypothetical protein
MVYSRIYYKTAYFVVIKEQHVNCHYPPKNSKHNNYSFRAKKFEVRQVFFHSLQNVLSELREEMERLMEAEAFIETAEFSGNQYGTTKQTVQQVLDSGTVLFLNDAFKLTHPILCFL